MSKTLTNLCQTIRRSAWRLSLILVLVVTALAAYRAVSTPAAAAMTGHSTPQTMSMNPVQQAVFAYLRAHHSNQPLQAPTTPDPAQQGVMNYLQAHGRADQSPTYWDQAVQAVRDYLRAHR